MILRQHHAVSASASVGRLLLPSVPFVHQLAGGAPADEVDGLPVGENVRSSSSDQSCGLAALWQCGASGAGDAGTVSQDSQCQLCLHRLL